MPSDVEKVTRRQPAAAPASSGGNSGYSTDESADGQSDNNNNRRKGDRRRGRKPNKLGGGEKEGGGKGGLLWLVLSIGLLFCLLDAAYISRVLDRPMQQATDGKSHAGGRSVLQSNGIQDLSEGSARAQQLKLLGDANAANLGPDGKPRRKPLTPEEKARREAEKKKADEDRTQQIKMAALEALKAEHGGKLPKDVEAKYLENDEAFKPRPMSEYLDRSLVDDKHKILQLFIEAGLKEMDDSTYAVLPTWSEVARLYGSEPKIIGLDQCEAFQSKGNPWDHFVSTSGTFNTGTNLMAETLIHNCHMQARMDKFGAKNRGVRWQVPWGKHTPPGDEEYRLNHKSKKDSDVDATMILPAVTVRDPYYWMQSMCKHHYTASWRSSDRCPNLTPDAHDKANSMALRDKDYFPVSVKYADFHKHHQSLTGFWNDWYNEYKGVEFHRLFVRYEDLLFHTKVVAEKVCHCAGGQMNKGKFQYVVDSAKKGMGAHGSVRTGYVDAIIKYGTERHRYNGFHPEDLKYAREHLDPALMEDFGYKYHPIELEKENDKKHVGQDGGNEHEDEEEEQEQEEAVDAGENADSDEEKEDGGDVEEEPPE